MVDKKNNMTFNIREQFKTFQSLQEKISSNEMEMDKMSTRTFWEPNGKK